MKKNYSVLTILIFLATTGYSEEWKDVTIKTEEKIKLRVVNHYPLVRFKWRDPQVEDDSMFPWVKTHKSVFYPLHNPDMKLEEYLLFIVDKNEKERGWSKTAYTEIKTVFENGGFKGYDEWTYLIREVYMEVRGEKFVWAIFYNPDGNVPEKEGTFEELWKTKKMTAKVYALRGSSWFIGPRPQSIEYFESMIGWPFNFNLVNEGVKTGVMTFTRGSGYDE